MSRALAEAARRLAKAEIKLQAARMLLTNGALQGARDETMTMFAKSYLGAVEQLEQAAADLIAVRSAG